MFSQNPATNTENSAQSRSEHIFKETTEAFLDPPPHIFST